jgi:hypothetical protein
MKNVGKHYLKNFRVKLEGSFRRTLRRGLVLETFNKSLSMKDFNSIHAKQPHDQAQVNFLGDEQRQSEK